MTPETSRIPLLGLLWMAAVVLIGAAVIGAAAALVGGFIFLVVVFPIFMGVAGGWMLAWAIRKGKVRSALTAVLAAVLMGVLMYGIYNAGDFLRFRRDVTEAITMEYGPQDQADIDLFIEMVLEDETGLSGFPGYLLLNAKDGVTLSRTYGSDGIVLNGVWYWLLFAVELGLIIYFAAQAAVKQARQPFCAVCDRWYSASQFLGFAAVEKEAELLAGVEQHSYHPMGDVLQGDAALPRVAVLAQTCGQCLASPARLTLRRQSLNYKKQLVQKDIKVVDVDPLQFNDLVRRLKATENLDA